MGCVIEKALDTLKQLIEEIICCSTCMDPESFVRGGPTLVSFLFCFYLLLLFVFYFNCFSCS